MTFAASCVILYVESERETNTKDYEKRHKRNVTVKRIHYTLLISYLRLSSRCGNHCSSNLQRYILTIMQNFDESDLLPILGIIAFFVMMFVTSI